jgi:hypothetical protein
MEQQWARSGEMKGVQDGIWGRRVVDGVVLGEVQAGTSGGEVTWGRSYHDESVRAQRSF